MMTGKVYGTQPRIEVALKLTGQPSLLVEFVVDTAFNGYISLPAKAIAALNLPFLHNLDARFASGSVDKTPIYRATVIWDGEEHNVQVLATDNKPLLGTALLNGYDLFISFENEGVVTITRR